MLKKIGTDDIRTSLGKILDCVNLRGDEFIIERKHQPLAALVPVAKLEALSRFAKSFALDMISGPASTKDEGKIDILANEAKHKSRRRRAKLPQKKAKK